MWNFSTQSALVAIIVAIATTVSLLLRSRRKLNLRFAFFSTGISLFLRHHPFGHGDPAKVWLIHLAWWLRVWCW